MSLKRSFVPVPTPEFDFADIDKYLTPDVAGALKRFNMLEIPHRYFKYAMQEVRTFLIPTSIATAATSSEASQAVDSAVQRAITGPGITEQQLTAQEHFEKGKQASKLDDQIAPYTEAIRLDPTFATAYNNRGLAYNDKGEFDKALEDLNTSIQLDPTSASAYSNRGISWFNKGENDRALRTATRRCVLTPPTPTLTGGRGATYMTKGELDKAIADFDEAARLNPDYPPIYISRAYAYVAKNDHHHAIADGEKALSLSPDAPWAKALKDDIAKWRRPKKLFGLF